MNGYREFIGDGEIIEIVTPARRNIGPWTRRFKVDYVLYEEDGEWEFSEFFAHVYGEDYPWGVHPDSDDHDRIQQAIVNKHREDPGLP